MTWILTGQILVLIEHIAKIDKKHVNSACSVAFVGCTAGSDPNLELADSAPKEYPTMSLLGSGIPDFVVLPFPSVRSRYRRQE